MPLAAIAEDAGIREGKTWPCCMSGEDRYDKGERGLYCNESHARSPKLLVFFFFFQLGPFLNLRIYGPEIGAPNLIRLIIGPLPHGAIEPRPFQHASSTRNRRIH